MTKFSDDKRSPHAYRDPRLADIDSMLSKHFRKL